jgi:hypothetical protein
MGLSNVEEKDFGVIRLDVETSLVADSSSVAQ